MKTLLFIFASLFVFQSVSAKALDAPAKTCEDFLTSETCDKLRDIAKVFHEQVSIVNEAVREAVAKHKANAQEIITFVKEYLVEKANNFNCKDVLSDDQCKQLIEFAAKFKVSVTDLMTDLKEAVADGIVQGKALFQKTKEILLEKLTNLSCDQLMDADTCQQIQDFAKKIGASAQEIRNALIDAYIKGLKSSKDFIAEAKRFLTEELSCDMILGEANCLKIQAFLRNTRVSFDEVMQKLKEAFTNGKSNTLELLKVAWTYIKENIWPFGFSELSDEKVIELMDMVEKLDL